MSLRLGLFIQVEGVTECSPGGPLWPQAHDCLQVLALPGTDPATRQLHSIWYLSDDVLWMRHRSGLVT